MCLLVPYPKKRRNKSLKAITIVPSPATEAELRRRRYQGRREERRERNTEIHEEKNERRSEVIEDIEWVQLLRDKLAVANGGEEMAVRDGGSNVERLEAGQKKLGERLADVEGQLQGMARQKELKNARKEGVAIGKAQAADGMKAGAEAKLRESEKEKMNLELKLREIEREFVRAKETSELDRVIRENQRVWNEGNDRVRSRERARDGREHRQERERECLAVQYGQLFRREESRDPIRRDEREERMDERVRRDDREKRRRMEEIERERRAERERDRNMMLGWGF